MVEKREIDILLVTYNAEKYIAQALDSIFNQTLCDNMSARIVVVDDCSKDGTLSIIHCKEKESPFPFKYIEGNNNLGITRNYQRAFSNCTADYVAVLEGDDYWCSPKHLQQHIDFLEEHKECSMSANRFVILRQSTGVMDSPNKEIICSGAYKLIALSDLFPYNHIGNFSSCVYRGSNLKKINQKIWDVQIDYVDDWMIAMELAHYGLIGQLQDCTTVYRQNDASTWANLSVKEKRQRTIHRIEECDKFYNYKYSKQFNAHKQLIKESISYNQMSEMRKKYPLIIVYVYEFVRHIPKLFLSPDAKNKLKKWLKK
ncbi:MAG: glycosyltransferase [Bacteroidales bacterium]|nr:glycosyltransferase [Bacteroidales bacterium]